MKVEIYSDLVCPWCYIGKRRFEQALASYAGADEVEVVYRPFQLNPATPETPEPAAAAYGRKFSTDPQPIFDHLTRAAAAEGLTFRMNDAISANTLQAHRLLWFAARHNFQAEVKERLLALHFTEGGNIGGIEELTAAGAAAGLDRDEVAAFLASHEGEAEVRAELGEAAQLGISSVPTFVFDGKVAVPGAQSPELLVEILERVAAGEFDAS
ncbi:DsbA family oxidoreductase [Streptacidiphilus rugosus]|uniref:DsbA family oxidoreductase n=1 Tax=Streptacidiphilus rugosus TaxID=405783 RepID=UPI00055F60B0|nr:DsbA family oxidoreductase [Streptacidiphilus rugosus]